MSSPESKLISGIVATGLVVLVLAGLSSALLLIVDASPLSVAATIVEGSAGSLANLGETLLRMIPVALIALSLIPSLRIGLFNIGAPGQMAIGALFATMPSLFLPDLPPYLILPLAFSAAGLGGALCAMICGVLRAKLRVNEILSTLVFNMLAALLLQYLLSEPLKGLRVNIPESDPFPPAAWLPVLIDGTRAHWGLALVVVLAIGVWLLDKSPLGYRLRMFGASPPLARQARVHAAPMILWTMAFAGLWAGVAGWTQAAGVDHRLYATVADPIGYTGLFAALLGRLHPLGVLLASLVFAALLSGGDYLQIGAGISPELIQTLIGLILLLLAGRSIMRART